MDLIEQFSAGLADRIAAAEPWIVGIQDGGRQSSGILWRPDVVVLSEQMLPDDATTLRVTRRGQAMEATLAGRDKGSNVAVLKLASALDGAATPEAAAESRVGSLALVLGADAAGAPTGRLAMVHAAGPAWHSMAGGRIDALIRLDCRLGADEGGPVLCPAGGLIGMSTSGPMRRTIVIPTATLTRVIDPLLAHGRIAHGWLGVGLQPVMIPDGLRQAAGRDSGLMVVSLAAGAPAEVGGVLQGDVLLEIDGTGVTGPRTLTAMLVCERIGQAVTLRILRAGAVQTLTVTVAARPT
jgi:S1-C subfamily serine protease